MSDFTDTAPPSAKKQKTDDLEDTMKILRDFRNDKTRVDQLRTACDALLSKHSAMCLFVLKLEETNARCSEGFSRAYLFVKKFPKDNIFAPPYVSYAVGSIFVEAYIMLREFLENRRVPADRNLREALKKLVMFTSLDHSALLEYEKGEEVHWAIRIAQHLLMPLSVAEDYIIDGDYNGLSKYIPKCPCKAGDRLNGKSGDTSFGLIDGWHGRTDILVNGVVVDLVDVNASISEEELELGSSAVSSSLPSTEEKFKDKDKLQIIAQTIVFSFLQRKERTGNVKNCLVPGIGISKKDVISFFYDCEADILLGTTEMELFKYGSWIPYSTILFLWLTLNYTLFCSGIKDSMKNYKAEFVQRAGDFIEKYRNDVTRKVGNRTKDNESGIDLSSMHYCDVEEADKKLTGEDIGMKFLADLA